MREDGNGIVTEYILLFGLGFCVSALLALILSPAIYRRVVTLTERRMRATVALTSAEVRAEKDAARAVFAADYSRLNENLKRERLKGSELAVERERLAHDLRDSRTALQGLEKAIAGMKEEGAALRAELDGHRERSAALQDSLREAEKIGGLKDQYIQDVTSRAEALENSVAEARIDAASRDAHAEALKSRINVLRDERAMLRESAKSAEQRARDLAIRLEREEHRCRALDEKLTLKMTELSDSESALERSRRELDRLRADADGDEGPRDAAVVVPIKDDAQVLKQARKDLEESRSEIEDLQRRLQDERTRADADRTKARAAILALEGELAGLREPLRREGSAKLSAFERARQERVRMMDGQHENSAISRRIERLRNRHAKLVSALSGPDSEEDDQDIRDEIAEIAAMMVDLTAVREGRASPIHDILAADHGAHGAGSLSLAERSRNQMKASADRD